MTNNTGKRKIIRSTEEKKPDPTPAPAAAAPSAPVVQKKRDFVTCRGCDSAVLASFINPKRGLCRICESREIANEVRPEGQAYNREGVNDARGEEHDAAMRDVIGTDQDDELTRVELETGEVVWMDAEGNIADNGQSRGQVARQSARNEALSKHADAWLRRQEEMAKLEATTDPAQFAMNKARKAAGLALRAIAEPYKPASDYVKLDDNGKEKGGQIQALSRLGWKADDLRVMRLTVAEASKLLQRGPKWLQKA